MRNSKIEWTDDTWNPIRGCSRVSDGCRNCYAEGVAKRFSGPGEPYEGLVRIAANGDRLAQWNGHVKFVEERLADPLRWKRPRRIFVNSMSDLFHPAVEDEWLDRIFGVMACCQEHTFQVLTKRPHRMLAYCSELPEWIEGRQNPLPNVWLGVSVEDQKTADSRIPVLLQTPAAVRFISVEPMLGPIHYLEGVAPWNKNMRIDWVICGGESGRRARPMRKEWAQGLRNQCQEHGVPFFFKQWGEWLPGLSDGAKGEDDEEQVLNVSDNPVRVGKHRSGRLLDGRTWDEFPAVRA